MPSTEVAALITPATSLRFDALTKRDGECVVWTASLRQTGYGQFNAGRSAEGRRVIVPAHRFAWIRANGPIPDGMCVCHRCDVRICVNPEHLFLGTYTDNNRDMFRKGRGHIFDGTHVLGEKHTQAKLTTASVREIRMLRDQGLPLHVIGARFGVTAANVSLIARRKAWAHVA